MNTPNTTDEVREKLIEISHMDRGITTLPSENKYFLGFEITELTDLVVRLITSSKKEGYAEAAKAYGGCEKCYGKGYFTSLAVYRSCADFIGDKSYDWEQLELKPCTCQRGRDFGKFLDKAKKEGAREALEKLKNYTISDYDSEGDRIATQLGGVLVESENRVIADYCDTLLSELEGKEAIKLGGVDGKYKTIKEALDSGERFIELEGKV